MTLKMMLLLALGFVFTGYARAVEISDPLAQEKVAAGAPFGEFHGALRPTAVSAADSTLGPTFAQLSAPMAGRSRGGLSKTSGFQSDLNHISLIDNPGAIGHFVNAVTAPFGALKFWAHCITGAEGSGPQCVAIWLTVLMPIGVVALGVVTLLSFFGNLAGTVEDAANGQFTRA